MTEPPAFQLYAADFYMDTVEWTAAQVGIYFRLLMYEWVNGAIPDDCVRLARIAGIDLGNFKKCYLQDIARKFTSNGGGELINLRLEETREKQRKYRELQKQKGIEGAKVRWGDDSHGHSNGYSRSNGRKIALQSSSSKEEKKEIKERKKEAQKPGDFFSKTELPEVERHCETLTTYFKKNFWPWIQSQIKKKYRADAIIFALGQLWEYRESTKDPWPYLNQIIVIEHQNLNEADHMAEHEKLKREEIDGNVPEFFK